MCRDEKGTRQMEAYRHRRLVEAEEVNTRNVCPHVGACGAHTLE
jgi:hypothetical protein